MKKALMALLAFLASIILPLTNVSAAGAAIDMSQYPSETLKEAFQADNINYTFAGSGYDDTDTANKTIIYVFRKDGCSNCKKFLQFIASDLLPNYANKFVVKSFEVSNNPINMSLVSRLARFYGQESANGSYGTPIVVAGSTFSTGFVDSARQAEIKSVIASGDTYDAVAAINQGAADFKSGNKTSFAANGITFTSNTGLNNNFSLRADPIDKSSVKLDGYDYISAYDISLYNYTTVVPVSGGSYTITLPVDKAYDSYRVAYIDGANQATEQFDVKVENGKVSFTTSHLSNYALYGRNGTVANKTSVSNPKTADPALIYGGIFAFSVVALIGGIIGYRKLNKRS